MAKRIIDIEMYPGRDWGMYHEPDVPVRESDARHIEMGLGICQETAGKLVYIFDQCIRPKMIDDAMQRREFSELVVFRPFVDGKELPGFEGDWVDGMRYVMKNFW
jgi:hypothetical protein